MTRRLTRIAVACAGAALGFCGPLVWVANHRARLHAPRASLWVEDRNGAFLTQAHVDRNASSDFGYWPVSRTPERVGKAILALEDRRFGAHPGVDPLALARALWSNVAGKRRVGASTIAMQIARLQKPAPRTLFNKLGEAATALALTARYSSDDLLRHYLRLSPFGNGTHGVAHAARYYFAKPVEDLSWAEIALLAGVPQSPTRLNLLREDGLRRARQRAYLALAELARRAVISPPEYAAAKNQLAALRRPLAPRRPPDLHAALHYEALARAGKLQAEGGDFRIRATLDLATQMRAQALARRYLAQWREAGAEQVALMVVARGAREVIARVGSAGYRDGPGGAFDFTKAERSPGSALKPFVYAYALDRGLLRANEILADAPEGVMGIGNADGQFLGPMLPRQALGNSRNAPAAQLVRRIGVEPLLRHLRDLGVTDTQAPPESFGLSIAIGALATRMDLLASAYLTLAEDGLAGELAEDLRAEPAPPRRVYARDVARLVVSMLSDAQARQPAFSRYGPLEYAFPVALKTGTSQGWRDAWTVAFSQKYLVVVWIGRGDAGSMRNVTGASAPARIANALLTQLHGLHPGEIAQDEFPAPQGRRRVELCAETAKINDGRCALTLGEFLLESEIDEAQDTGRISLVNAQTTGEKRETRIVERVERRIKIVSPENDVRLWRNPNQPDKLNQIALRAETSPDVKQILWTIDGKPYALAEPGQTIYWPMQSGAHRIQARHALTPGGSAPVRVTVE